jgi:hypothetical protein
MSTFGPAASLSAPCREACWDPLSPASSQRNSATRDAAIVSGTSLIPRAEGGTRGVFQVRVAQSAVVFYTGTASRDQEDQDGESDLRQHRSYRFHPALSDGSARPRDVSTVSRYYYTWGLTPHNWVGENRIGVKRQASKTSKNVFFLYKTQLYLIAVYK